MYRLILLALLVPTAALGAGQDVPAPLEAPAAATNAAAEQPDPDTTATISRYRQQIQSLQAEHGAYAPGLSEAMLGLGRAYSRAGDHKEAADAFKSALYVSRVNTGLYSMTQMPYLQSLIDEYDRLGKLDRASDLYSYMFWVYRRNFGSQDLRTLPAVERMQKWLESVFRRGGDLSLEQLQQLVNVNLKAVRILQENYGASDPRLIDPLRRYSEANLFEAEQLRRSLERRQVRVDLGACGFITLNDANRRESYMGQEETMMVLQRCKNYENGKLALQHILAIHKHNDLPPLSYVRALTRLGDWEMVFDRQYAARDYYSRAYDMLGKSEDGGREITELFGQPRILPALDTLPGTDTPPQQEKDNDGKGSFAVVSLDVTSTGRPRNIKVVESDPPQDEDLQYAAQRYLKDSKFRPRLEDGKPVDTVGYTLTFRQDE